MADLVGAGDAIPFAAPRARQRLPYSSWGYTAEPSQFGSGLVSTGSLARPRTTAAAPIETRITAGRSAGQTAMLRGPVSGSVAQENWPVSTQLAEIIVHQSVANASVT